MASARRERRAAERRQQILAAALAVFAEKGYHRATTRDIAEAADVAEGTLYNYFDGKDDLLVGVVGQMAQLDWQRSLFEGSLEQDPAEFFSQYLRLRLQMAAPQQILVAGILPELLHHPRLREQYNREIVQPFLTVVEQHIQARVERGQLRPVDAPVVVRALLGMLLGMQLLQILGDPVTQDAWQQPGPMIAEMTTLILDGLRARPAEPPGEDSY